MRVCECGKKRTNLNYKTKHWKLLRKLVLRASRIRGNMPSFIRFESHVTCELAARRDSIHVACVGAGSGCLYNVYDSISVLFVAYLLRTPAKWIIRPRAEQERISRFNVRYIDCHTDARFSVQSRKWWVCIVVGSWLIWQLTVARIKNAMFDICRRSRVGDFDYTLSSIRWLLRLLLIRNVILILLPNARRGARKNVFA